MKQSHKNIAVAPRVHDEIKQAALTARETIGEFVTLAAVERIGILKRIAMKKRAKR